MKIDTYLGDALERIPGVKEAKFTGAGKLCIQYDLTKLRFGQIEENIRVSGYVLADGLPARWKRSWIDFTEENEYYNMMSRPTPCCSNPKGIILASRREDYPLIVSTLTRTTKEKP